MYSYIHIKNMEYILTVLDQGVHYLGFIMLVHLAGNVSVYLIS